MRKLLTIISLFIGIGQISAQQPVIANIDPVSGYPSSRVVIAGSGFGTDPTNLVVWFGSVRATIKDVQDNMIVVDVPPQASSDNVTVVNLTSALASQSDEKFFPAFSGAGFDPVKTEAISITSAQHVYDPCSCDLDGDGKPDVVVTKFDGGGGISDPASNITLLHNESTAENLSFTESQIFIGLSTTNIRCGDLNGDGKPDLYMSRGGSSRFNVLILENTSVPGTISFAPLISLAMDTDVKSRRVNHKDLNGDGKPEIVVTDSDAGEVIIFENTSSGSISFAAAQTVPVAGATSTSGLDIQDVDNDGKADIIVGQFLSDNLFILRNTSTGSISFAQSHVLQLTDNALLNLTTGDFNHDGLLEIAVIGNSGDRVFVFPNNSSPGTINFGTPASIMVNDGPWGITTGDVNGDGKLDIVGTSINQNDLSVLINGSTDAAISFSKVNLGVGKRSRNVAITDLDGDAKPDFIVTSFVNPSTSFETILIRNKNCYQPEILNDQPMALCPGQSITLATPPSPAVAFKWTEAGDPATTLSTADTLEITSFGNYTVTATSESGACVLTASVNVANGAGTVPGDPVAANNGPACLAGELQLSVNEVVGATYKWSGPDNFSSTQREPLITNVTHDIAGIYTVFIQSGDCRSAKSETIVEVVTMPVFNLNATGDTEVCAGTNVTLQTEFRAGYNYQWLKDGVDISGAVSNSYVTTTSGLFSVRVNDTASNCSQITNEVQVNVYTPPTADFTIPANACVGEEITFTNNSIFDASAPVTYSWTFGDGQTSTAESPAHSYPTEKSYTVTLTVRYAGVAGCSSSKSKGIPVKAPVAPVIESAETSMCPGDDLALAIPDTYTSTVWNTSATTNSITIHQPGTYSVTAVDVAGCTAYSEITIDSKTVPALRVDVVPDPADTVVSAGAEVRLEATGADTYSWTPTNSLSDSTIANPVARPEETTTYLVTGTLSGGCSATAEITITVKKGGEVDITPLKAFSPNSTMHRTWYIENVENYQDDNCTLSIFDERGTVVFRQKNYSNAAAWDATYNGSFLPEGVYYYVFGCEGLNPKTGSVLVVR